MILKLVVLSILCLIVWNYNCNQSNPLFLITPSSAYKFPGHILRNCQYFNNLDSLVLNCSFDYYYYYSIMTCIYESIWNEISQLLFLLSTFSFKFMKGFSCTFCLHCTVYVCTPNPCIKSQWLSVFTQVSVDTIKATQIRSLLSLNDATRPFFFLPSFCLLDSLIPSGEPGPLNTTGGIFIRRIILHISLSFLHFLGFPATVITSYCVLRFDSDFLSANGNTLLGDRVWASWNVRGTRRKFKRWVLIRSRQLKSLLGEEGRQMTVVSKYKNCNSFTSSATWNYRFVLFFFLCNAEMSVSCNILKWTDLELLLNTSVYVGSFVSFKLDGGPFDLFHIYAQFTILWHYLYIFFYYF